MVWLDRKLKEGGIIQIYKYFDWNPKTNHEYDIVGDDYRRLMELCFKYSQVMSFMNCSPDTKILDLIEEYHISRPKNVKVDNSIYGLGYLTDEKIGLNFYRLCPELMGILLSHTSSIFEWLDGWEYKNPENPVFYRKDGSVFFSSIIHEGEVTLSVKDDEEVSEIVSTEGWNEVSDFNFHFF